jgi:hypothetical protein
VHDGDVAGAPGGPKTGFYLRGLAFPVEYRIFVQDDKWLPWVRSGDNPDWTSGNGKVLEAIQFRFPEGIPSDVKLLASVNVGYYSPIVDIKDGTILGTPGTDAVLSIQIAQGDKYTGDEILATPTPTPVHYRGGVPDLPHPLPPRKHAGETQTPTPPIVFGGRGVFPSATQTPTPQSHAVRDLSIFPAGPGKLGIRNNGAVCHTAIIAWSVNATIGRYKVPAFNQITLPVMAGVGTLIGEDPCQ